VTEARANATRVQLNASDLSDPAKVQAFNEAQGRLTQAIIPLQRLQEAYPDLKSNQNFLALQDQLEGTENRINASRRDYNDAVQQYNTLIRTFPTAIGAKVFYGAKPKVPFQATGAAQQAPTVNFNTAG
jgi:LemA protein